MYSSSSLAPFSQHEKNDKATQKPCFLLLLLFFFSLRSHSSMRSTLKRHTEKRTGITTAMWYIEGLLIDGISIRTKRNLRRRCNCAPRESSVNYRSRENTNDMSLKRDNVSLRRRPLQIGYPQCIAYRSGARRCGSGLIRVCVSGIVSLAERRHREGANATFHASLTVNHKIVITIISALRRGFSLKESGQQRYSEMTWEQIQCWRRLSGEQGTETRASLQQ